MSKVVKGVKKVFKKVVKVIKKVVPIVLAAAAIYFTAGAALGVTAAWGGASGVAAGVTSSLGTGVLGSTVTGALSAAGYGAAIGGVVSAAQGGDFMDGAAAGAKSGAIAGGVLGLGKGLMAARTAANAGAGGATTHPMPDPGVPGAGEYIDAAGNPIAGAHPPGYDPSVIPGAGGAGGTFDGPYAPGGGPSAANAPNVPIDQNLPPAGGLSRSGPVLSEIDRSTLPKPRELPPINDAPNPGFLEKGGWVERNPELVGGAIKGIGSGLMAGAAGDADIDFIRERQNLINANYKGTDPGANFNDLAPQRSDRYDPRSYGSWEYQYDAVQGRIIKVPVGG